MIQQSIAYRHIRIPLCTIFYIMTSTIRADVVTQGAPSSALAEICSKIGATNSYASFVRRA